eukprot:TRINITY_DN1115_c0_g1_i4.p2 TRINITY_DN1115_c0_g1~~TRINITY_DN1115_c0_g1_i4.p2  ORF type:complete len:164 (+),score=40.94 TRINITY_DN1115_c0_g1_i4:116-607(+)
MREINAWFAAVDTDRSGHITANELRNCTFGGIPLGYETAYRLVKVFDRDNSNSIDFHEYAAMHKFLATLQAAWFAADTDRSGRLDGREIHTALGAAGFAVSYPAVMSVFASYARTEGSIDFSSFLQLAARLARLKSIFEWEDKAKRGVIQLTFDRMVEIVGTL